MGSNSFIELVNRAEFNKCLKETSDDNHLNKYEKNISLALIRRYQGFTDQAITLLEELYREKSENDFYNLQVSLLLLYCYFLENKTARFISDVRSYISFLSTQIKMNDIGHFWHAIYDYTEGKIHENNNELYKTIQSYLESVRHLEKQNNKYELAQGYFLLSSGYRSYGDYFNALENVEKSLKILPKADYVSKARFSNYLAELLFLRSSDNQKKALNYLQQSLENWNNLTTNSGKEKTIHNLGLANYIAVNLSQAFTYLNEYYEIIREQVSIQDNVRFFLLLIELLTGLKNISEAENYLKKLKTFINMDLLYEDEIQLAEAFLIRELQSLSYQIIPLKVFEKLTEKNKSDYEIKLRLLLNHLDLFLVELKFAQTNEVLTITEGLAKQVLDYSEKSYEITVQTTLLIRYFKSLQEDKNQDIPFNAITLKEINPILHSLPIIYILLYILPRKGVTLEELKEVSGLNKEKINDTLIKLHQYEFVSSEEIFILDKKVMTYSMTESGIREFETYLKSLTEIIQGFFVA